MTKRLLIKLSGESLSEKAHLGLNPLEVHRQAKELANLVRESQTQVAVVIGGGNLWRGSRGSGKEIERVASDQIGMMATVMNAIALASSLKIEGIPTLHLCAFEIPGVALMFQPEVAINALESGHIVIFSGGTGLPFFSTDTASALRAVQIGAHEIFKATQVDGIYEKDPKQFPEAKRLEKLTYQEVKTLKIEVMDSMAFDICSQSNTSIRVFKNEPGSFLKACLDPSFGSWVTN
jgi:uridylate kinase